MTGDHNAHISDYTALAVHQNGSGEVRAGTVVNTISTNSNASGRNAPLVSYQEVTGPLMANSHPGSYTGQDAYNDMFVVRGVDCRNFAESETYPTLQAKSNGGTSLNYSGALRENIRVRRLTPLECERLQGYPDGWTDIPGASDTARYRALGNSIAIPPWKWALKRISAHYERDATLGSLFDGIGGFPYAWEQINGKGSCLWASEIEPFCIKVTTERFGGTP